MGKDQILEEAMRLPVDERRELAERLWESVGPSPAEEEVPDWHIAEVRKAVTEADANPDDVVEWDDFRKQLEQRPRK